MDSEVWLEPMRAGTPQGPGGTAAVRPSPSGLHTLRPASFSARTRNLRGVWGPCMCAQGSVRPRHRGGCQGGKPACPFCRRDWGARRAWGQPLHPARPRALSQGPLTCKGRRCAGPAPRTAALRSGPRGGSRCRRPSPPEGCRGGGEGGSRATLCSSRYAACLLGAACALSSSIHAAKLSRTACSQPSSTPRDRPATLLVSALTS